MPRSSSALDVDLAWTPPQDYFVTSGDVMRTGAPSLSAANIINGEPYAPAYAVHGLTAAAAFAVALSSAHVPLQASELSAAQTVFYSLPARAISGHLLPALAEMNSYRALKAGWDGVGSLAPSSRAIDLALEFLRLLSGVSTSPQGTVSADGMVGWFWKNAGSSVSVLFNSAGRMSYVGRTPDLRVRGAIMFDGQTLPSDLLALIRKA